VDYIGTNVIHFLEMFRNTRSLSKREIEKCLIFDNIPSGSDLESYNENHDDFDNKRNGWYHSFENIFKTFSRRFI